MLGASYLCMSVSHGLQSLWFLISLQLPSSGTDEATYTTVEANFSLYERFIFLWSKKTNTKTMCNLETRPISLLLPDVT
jgi:hypothetical protein